MDLSILIWSYFILLLMSISLLIISTIKRSWNLTIISSVAILGLMNTPYFNEVSVSIGVGIPIILMSLVAICLIISFRLDVFTVPSYIMGNSGKLLIVVLICAILSLFFSIHLLVTSKAVMSLAMIFFIGWLLFGKIYPRYKDESRSVVLLICGTFGFLSLLNVIFVLSFAGPAVLRGEIGGSESTISIIGLTVQRLQVEGFNATGVGISSGIALLWLFSVYKRIANRPITKIITILLIIVSMLVLIWSGSRGAIVAFFATWIALQAFNIMGRKNKILHISGTVLLSCVVLYVFIFEFKGILYRGLSIDSAISLFDIVYSGRLGIFDFDIKFLFEPTVFGHGFGFLSTDANVIGRINIESFFLRIFIELGFVGAIMYFSAFIVLTIHVVRADIHYYLDGEKGAFLASSILLFTWFNSITSFGFSIPVGSLAIQLAIAVGAMFSLCRQQETRNTEIRTVNRL